jgi:hypothetical protein
MRVLIAVGETGGGMLLCSVVWNLLRCKSNAISFFEVAVCARLLCLSIFCSFQMIASLVICCVFRMAVVATNRLRVIIFFLLRDGTFSGYM